MLRKPVKWTGVRQEGLAQGNWRVPVSPKPLKVTGVLVTPYPQNYMGWGLGMGLWAEFATASQEF